MTLLNLHFYVWNWDNAFKNLFRSYNNIFFAPTIFAVVSRCHRLSRQLVVLFACRTFIKNERYLISSKMSHFTAHPRKIERGKESRGGERMADAVWLFAVVAKTDLSALHCSCCRCLRWLKAFQIALSRSIRPPVWHVPPPRRPPAPPATQ